MRSSGLILRLVIVAFLLAAVGGGVYKFWYKSGSSGEAVEHHGEHAHEEEAEELSDHAVKVSPGEIEVYVKAPGIVNFHPKYALRVHPAFPGVVTRVLKTIGDSVNAGEALAYVESNVGIQVYTVSSPIKGIILAKDIGAGQSVNPEDEIFSVGDASVLQARVAISARDVLQVKTNQEILLLAEDRKSVKAKITFLSPILTEDTRTAPAIIDFSSSDLRPGMFVTGAIVVSKRAVPKMLPLRFCENGIQEATVNVITATGHESREVRFGERDYYNCEVVDGLREGESVANDNFVASNQEEETHEHHDE